MARNAPWGRMRKNMRGFPPASGSNVLESITTGRQYEQKQSGSA